MNLKSAIRALSKFAERTQDETLHQERCARRVARDLVKKIYKLKNADKATFHSPIEARATPAPTTKSPQEREFVVDLVNAHAEQKRLETLRISRIPTSVVTANGEVQTNEEVQVFVHDLDLFVTVQILDDTSAVLSLGRLCEEHGCTSEWASGQKPQLTKQGKNIICKTETTVHLVVPGLSSNSGTSSSSTSPPQDPSSTSSSPASERSDEPAPAKLKRLTKNSQQIKKEG